MLDLIALLEFDGVDIGLFEGRSHLWPSRVFDDLPSSARELASKLRDRGLEARPTSSCRPPRTSSRSPPTIPTRAGAGRRATGSRGRVEFAAECGGRHVSALPGVHFEGVPEAESFGRCCDELAWRCETAREQGITFSRRGPRRLDRADARRRRPTRAVGPRADADARLHPLHPERASPDSEIEPLVAHASHFHARGARPGRLQASFKENVIDYGRVLDVMRQVGYAGYVGVEYVWIDWEHCNEVDNLSETILLRDLLRNHRTPA